MDFRNDFEEDERMVPPRLSIVPSAGSSRQAGTESEKAAAAAPTPGSQPAPSHGLPANVAALPSADRRERLRMLEALLFAASEPIDERTLAAHLRSMDDITPLLEELKGFYAGRGINLVRVGGKWSFRTADDLAFLLERHAAEERRLSKAALETLAIVAYHQPVTRAEIEEIRGVSTSKGSLDVLLETGWVRLRGRRRAPGRPVTYGTTEAFLSHFGLDSIKDLPGLAELKGAGLLDATLPPDFKVPEPYDAAALMPDEVPLDDGPEGDEPETEDELESEQDAPGAELNEEPDGGSGKAGA
jgi:segregation and condensation protein B